MTLLNNKKGIALITALLFTLLSLGIVMTLLYMVILGTKVTGAEKRYKTALEASYGATELIAKDILPSIFKNYTTAASIATVPASFYGVSLAIPDSSCLAQKTQKPTLLWNSTLCTAPSKTSTPSESPDMTFNLKASNDSTGYKVYSKIVDTRCGGDPTKGQTCSNSDSSGIDYLDGGGGVTGGGGVVQPQPRPAFYKIEIQGERASNPREKSKLSVLYAY